MAQTFSQLIRVHSNIAVKYEIKVIPEKYNDGGSKTLRWFKHKHWKETLKLLRPVVQTRISQETLSEATGSSTIKGVGIIVVFSFKPSSSSWNCLTPKSKPDFDENIQVRSKKTRNDQYADLGGLHSRYKIYCEKLVAAVGMNDCYQSLPEYKQHVLLNQLSGKDQDTKSPYFAEDLAQKPSKSSSSNDFAVYTCTESITCHQDSNGNATNQLKALSSCQLGNKHKCRSSAVKLSPVSAIAQENIAVGKCKDSVSSNSIEDAKKLRKPLDSSLASKAIKHECKRSKLSLKRCMGKDSIGDEDLSILGTKRPKRVVDGGSVENINSQADSQSISSPQSQFSSSSSPSKSPSSLITSTESVTCTLIDRNGKKNVTSPKHIRLVNNFLESISSSSVNSSSTTSATDGRLCFDSCIKSDCLKPKDDHQAEMSRMFDRLIAHSVTDSSHGIGHNVPPSICSSASECSTELNSCDKASDSCRKKRRHSFVKLFKKHGLANSDYASDESKNQISVDTSSKSYERLKLKLKSVRHLKDLPEDTMDDWFYFNDYYLKGIYEGKIYCRRHDDFYIGGRCRLRLNRQVNLSLFKEDQLDFIMDRLMETFSGSKSTQATDYLLKVMLPEVLVKIFMDVHGIDHENSEKKMSEMRFAQDKSPLAIIME